MPSPAEPRFFVTGGAGFIGMNLVRRLLSRGEGGVTVFDDFSTGRRSHLEGLEGSPRLRVVEGDARDADALARALAGHETVFHLASNSDIARAAVEPDVDFSNGTLLTRNVLEAMRKTGVKRIAFTSGSGVYGEVPPVPIPEDYPTMIPISTYGASKLSSEALISAYSFMFELRGMVFRFANVVGPHQTHGVAFDFLRRLAADPKRLLIYGDGTQSKPYIHVEDVLDAVLLVAEGRGPGFVRYNVASQDFLSVREVADIVVARMGIPPPAYEFTGGSRGWKADVPVYRLDTARIRSLGWSNKRDSRRAVEAAVDAMLSELKAGLP